ncbi:hypothetical protein ACHQM5_009259 [Ranunculus cassubicifolius]
MGRTLDRLLRRTFKTAQFKATVNLAISRLAIMKNQKQTRLSHARSDTVQLLNLDQNRALLRVEVVIKEQNMLDVFVMMEGYCHVLIERVAMIENQKLYTECPEELNEAVSCVVYAASRCGEFPELQELRSIFAVRFGKDFIARAVELRNNSGVNHKMVQKLSTRQPSREIRMKILQEIASENGITLKLDEEEEEKEEVAVPPTPKPDPEPRPEKEDYIEEVDHIKPDERTYSGSLRRKQKYADVASAAQAAFESAAYAAAAARAAVELSQSDPGSPGSQRRNRSNSDNFSRSGLGNPAATPSIENYSSESEEEIEEQRSSRRGNRSNSDKFSRSGLGNAVGKRSIKNYSSESEEEIEEQKVTRKVYLRRSPSSSSSDSDGELMEEIKPENKVVFDKSDDENGNDYYAKNRQNNTVMDNEQAQFKTLNIGRKPISVRNRKWQAL